MTAHCNCGRTWDSLVECHCTVCHRQFSNVASFDKHDPRRGGCPDPATRTDANGNWLLQAVDRPGGPVWVKWVSEDDRAAMRARFTAAKEAKAGSRGAPRSDRQPQKVSPEG